MKRLKHIGITTLSGGVMAFAASLFLVALMGIEPDEGGLSILFFMFLVGCVAGAIASLFTRPFHPFN